MIEIRRNPALRRGTFFNGGADGGPPDVVWHGVEPRRPDFAHESRTLVLAIDGRACDRPVEFDRDIYIAMNAWHEPLAFRVPESPSGRPWRRAVDTAMPATDDALGPDEGPVMPPLHSYGVRGHSLIVLVSEA
jgi:isoamylase